MAKDIKISATRIGTFLSCKQKYWFSYHERLPKLSNAVFRLGLAVHSALEFAGKIWLEKNKFSKADIKAILEEYDKVAVDEGVEDLDVHAAGKLLVKLRVNDFMTGTKLIGLETKFGFGFGKNDLQVKTKDGISLIGAIDKIEEIDEDTLLIIDYKTSKTSPTVDQLKNDPQLSIYDFVASKLWPQYKRIILSLDLLRLEPIYTYRTNDERSEFEDYIKIIYDQMVELKPENVKASLNLFCPWCDYKDYCGMYKKACSNSTYKFLPTTNYTNDQLIQEWSSVKSTKKVLESRERELGMIIMEKIKRGAKNLIGNKEEVYVRQNARTTYDLDSVYKMVPADDFHKLVNINKKAVTNYMTVNPVVKEELERTSTTNYTSPFLAIKKIKIKSKSKKKKGEG